MNIRSIFKYSVITVVGVAVIVGAYLVYALAGLNSQPVVFADPPSFVERYARTMTHSASWLESTKSKSKDMNIDESSKFTKELSSDEKLVFNAIVHGESLDLVLRLFSHPEKKQRVKIASAFAFVNVKFSHDDESGYPEKRKQFWIDAKEHLPNMRNALSEALITSAEEGTKNHIPYSLAWLPGQGHETVELLAWAAKHHPDWWVRRFSVYFVVKFGGDEKLARPLLDSRTHDPDYRVRKEVLDRRVERLIG